MGLGREYSHYCNILHSRELLQGNKENREEYKIIAYCDEKKMEYIAGYHGQHLFWDIATLLEENDFELLKYEMHAGCKQSDSLWVNREFIKQK